MVFLQEQIHVLCSHKKAMLLEELHKSSKTNFGLDVAAHVEVRDNDGSGLIEITLSAIGAGKKSSYTMVGWLLKEAPKGALME